ncbi:MAG TPA: hypothetical protein ENN73_01500 [Firmicutes bacterium]|nr:hypothetical protein [Bacillota bacterium]
MAENFEKIKESILNFSETKGSEIIEKAMKLADTKFIEEKKKINSEFRKRRKEVENEFEKEKIKRYSKYEIAFENEKRQIIEVEVKKLLSRLKELLIEVKKDRKVYTDILFNLLKESVAALGTSRIKVFHAREDAVILTDKFINRFKSETDCIIEEQEPADEIFGGFIIEDLNEAGVLFDNSFNLRLEMIIPSVREELSRLLEPEEENG